MFVLCGYLYLNPYCKLLPTFLVYLTPFHAPHVHCTFQVYVSHRRMEEYCSLITLSSLLQCRWAKKHRAELLYVLCYDRNHYAGGTPGGVSFLQSHASIPMQFLAAVHEGCVGSLVKKCHCFIGHFGTCTCRNKRGKTQWFWP